MLFHLPMIYKIFCLSRRSNGFGAEIEYQVVKDFSEKEDLDYIDFFEVLKNLNAKVSWVYKRLKTKDKKWCSTNYY